MAIAPTLGTAVVRDEVQERVIAAAEGLARDAGLRVVDVPVQFPELDLAWALGNLAGLRLEDLRGPVARTRTATSSQRRPRSGSSSPGSS